MTAISVAIEYTLSSGKVIRQEYALGSADFLWRSDVDFDTYGTKVFRRSPLCSVTFSNLKLLRSTVVRSELPDDPADDPASG